MPFTDYIRATSHVPTLTNGFTNTDANALSISTGNVEGKEVGDNLVLAWSANSVNWNLPDDAFNIRFEFNVLAETTNGDGITIEGKVGFFFLGIGIIFNTTPITNDWLESFYVNRTIGGVLPFPNAAPGAAIDGSTFEWTDLYRTKEYIEANDIYFDLKVSSAVNNDTVNFSGNDNVPPSIALRLWYDLPTPKKLLLKPTGNNIVTKSFRPASTTITTNATNLESDPVGASAIRTPNNGFVLFSNQDDAPQPSILAVPLNAIADSSNETNVTTIGNIGIENVNSITTKFIYQYTTSTGAANNRFQVGWAYEPSSTITSNNHTITTAAQDIFNLPFNINPNLHTHTLSSSDLNSLITDVNNNIALMNAGALKFIIRFTDDNPDNSFKIYGQSSAGEEGFSAELSIQPSLEFTINYNTPVVHNKVKIMRQPDSFLDDAIIPGSHIKTKLKAT